MDPATSTEMQKENATVHCGLLIVSPLMGHDFRPPSRSYRLGPYAEGNARIVRNRLTSGSRFHLFCRSSEAIVCESRASSLRQRPPWVTCTFRSQIWSQECGHGRPWCRIRPVTDSDWGGAHIRRRTTLLESKPTRLKSRKAGSEKVWRSF